MKQDHSFFIVYLLLSFLSTGYFLLLHNLGCCKKSSEILCLLVLIPCVVINLLCVPICSAIHLCFLSLGFRALHELFLSNSISSHSPPSVYLSSCLCLSHHLCYFPGLEWLCLNTCYSPRIGFLNLRTIDILEPNNSFLWGLNLCFVRFLAESLASIH